MSDWTHEPIEVRRDQCAIPGCKERPRYADEFGQRLCGPHFRAARREADELAAVRVGEAASGLPTPDQTIPTATLTQEIPMPLDPTKMPLNDCQWPGCDRPVLRHRFCARDIQRVRKLGEPPNTERDAGELARMWEERQTVPAGERNRHPSPAAPLPAAVPPVVDVVLIDTDTDTDIKRPHAPLRLRSEPLDQIALLIGTDPDGSDAEIVEAVRRHVQLTQGLHTQLDTLRKEVEDATFLRQALQMLGSPRDRDLKEGLEQLTDADGALVAELIARCLKAKAPTPGAVLTIEDLTQRWAAWEEGGRLAARRGELLDNIAVEYANITHGFQPGDAFVEALDARIAMLRRVALGGA